MTFTRSEVAVLMEALDAWVQKDLAGEVIGMTLGAIMCRTDEDRAAFEAARKKDKAKIEDAKRNREERAVLLKAKLLGARDALDVEEVTRQ